MKGKKLLRAFFLWLSSAIFGLSMSKNYKQLSLEQRYQIEALLKGGHSQKSIASILGVHPSTISRELKRNVGQRGRRAGIYLAHLASRKTQLRHKKKYKRIKFDDAMKRLVAGYLRQERWSPEFISHCLDGVRVSHEWIYQWIWNCKSSHTKANRSYKNLYKYLRHGRRKRKRGNLKDSRGVIANRRPIHDRPAIVAKRQRLGDLEVDLMMGKNHKGAILVVTDRASLVTRLKKLASKESEEVLINMIAILSELPCKAKTLTFDNDKAFTCHEVLEKQTGIKAYFTRPYTSQDKGTVENRIGVLRRFIPKKSDLKLVTKENLSEIETKLNRRPVRKFNYKTPNQVLLEKLHL